MALTDDELHAAAEAAWGALRKAAAEWQRLAKEQARRDALKKRKEEFDAGVGAAAR